VQLYAKRRIDDWFAPSLNVGLAREVLGDLLTEELAADLTWASEISPALSELRGNPRQVKRFLNDLTWRRRAAARRQIELRHDVLAKLMVLDIQSAEDFQTLFDWQLRADGPVPELGLAEATARVEPAAPAPEPAPDPTPAKKATGRTAQRGPRPSPSCRIPDRRSPTAGPGSPAGRPGSGCHRTSPLWTCGPTSPTSGTGSSSAPSRRRSPAQQALLARLQSEVTIVSRDALEAFKQHPEDEQDDLLEALLDATNRRPDSPLLITVCELAGRNDRLAPTVCDALGRIPHRALPPLRIVSVLQRLDRVAAADGLRSAWSGSDVAWLAKATSTALRPRAGA